MIKSKKDSIKQNTSQAIGLDISLSIVKFITGKDNLHYGYWKDLDTNLSNLGLAQELYTQHLLSYLPNKKSGHNLKILDIGGGSGQTASYLIKMGHDVTIIVPSLILAKRAIENTKNKATIHLTTFENYEPKENEKYDICLYSESFQYIPINISLRKSKGLLNPGGHILIADCFRSNITRSGIFRKPGGGHPLSLMFEELKNQHLTVIAEDEITKIVAPSIEIEQEFYNIIGFSLKRIAESWQINRPIMLKIILILYKILIRKRKRLRLESRLFSKSRSIKEFCKYNHYMIFLLKKTKIK